MNIILSKFSVGGTLVRFDCTGDGTAQLSMRPKNLSVPEHREFLPDDVEIRGLPDSRNLDRFSS
jgi:hypothetical protein